MTDDTKAQEPEGLRIARRVAAERAIANMNSGNVVPLVQEAPEPPEDDGSDQGAPAFKFTDGAKFILDVPDRVPAIWGTGDEVLWAQDESLMIAGTLGVGKTTLALLLLRARLGLADQVLDGAPPRLHPAPLSFAVIVG
jgi:hypothetical protein